MTEHTTTRSVDLVQLGGEISGDPAAPAPLSMVDDGTERTITVLDDTTTTEILQTAVNAHEPAPVITTEAWLQRQINDLTDLILFG